MATLKFRVRNEAQDTSGSSSSRGLNENTIALIALAVLFGLLTAFAVGMSAGSHKTQQEMKATAPQR